MPLICHAAMYLLRRLLRHADADAADFFIYASCAMFFYAERRRHAITPRRLPRCFCAAAER